jgi:ATP-dependent Clp protease adapter protein ClpS
MSRIPAEQPEVPGHNKTDGPRQLTRYHVVLLYEPTQDLMHVIRSVMQLTRFPREEATHKMWEAHHSGRSVLLTTYLERGELYAELFREHGLTVVVERA